MRRLPVLVLAVSFALIVSVAAEGAGPGGWDHLGTGGTPGSDSLNGGVHALNSDAPGILYVGGAFTGAGGISGADHIATWNGSTWAALGAPPLTGDVNAIAYSGGRVFAGGTFQNAGGNPDADFLAVWNGSAWAPFCNANGPAFGGNVNALQIIGSTLYVGGAYQNGAGIASADYLLACDLTTGAARSLVAADGDSTGAIYALTADSAGNLYAGGTFINMAGIPEADHVAAYDGAAWHAMGGSAGTPAVTGIVRGLGASGTDVFVGTDATDVAGIPQADHVARWDGSAWSAMGANADGSDGWFPASTFIYAITAAGSQVFVGGSFQNAGGDPTADEIASFDGSAWHPVGSNGAGDGPLNANVLALATFGQQLIAGGAFTSAGGDSLAGSAASFSLVAGPPPPVALPPPVIGVSVNAVAEKGTVLVKLPKGAAAGAKDRWTRAAAAGFVPLGAAGRHLPVGSVLDTTKGTVKLSTAANTAGATQLGHFSQGLFSVTQGRKNPLTTMSMTGSGLNSCSRLPRGGSAKVTAARKRSRSLFSNVKGHFRTRGRNSAATVRGTRYLVKDTCKGTRTSVSSGTVLVRDFSLRKTKKVKAGHSYFARAPKKR